MRPIIRHAVVHILNASIQILIVCASVEIAAPIAVRLGISWKRGKNQSDHFIWPLKYSCRANQRWGDECLSIGPSQCQKMSEDVRSTDEQQRGLRYISEDKYSYMLCWPVSNLHAFRFAARLFLISNYCKLFLVLWWRKNKCISSFYTGWTM